MAMDCFLISLYGAFGLGLNRLHAAHPRSASALGRRILPAALLWCVIAVPTIVQLTVWPGLHDVLRRDGHRIVHGQLWRLVSAVLVQDGGTNGAVFNLISLALLAPVVALTVGRRAMWLSFAAGMIGGEVVGLAWQPHGAGNSVGCCGLAAAILVWIGFDQDAARPQRWLAGALGAVGLVQVALAEVHGAAFATGLVAMGVFVVAARTRPQIAARATTDTAPASLREARSAAAR